MTKAREQLFMNAKRAKSEEIMDNNLWIKPINQRNFSCSLSRTRIVVDMRVAKWKEYIL